MQTIKSLPLVMVMAMTGAITTFNSYADMTDSKNNNPSNSSAIPYSNTTETSGFYLSGQLGTQLTNNQANILRTVTKSILFFNQSDYQTEGNIINLLGGIALGYQANNNFRFELTYNDNLTQKSANNYYFLYLATKEATFHSNQKTQLDTSLQTTMFNAYYTFDTHNKFSPFIMAGVGVAHLNASMTETGVGADENKKGNFSYLSSGKLTGKNNNFAFNMGVGGSYHLTPNLYLDGMVSYVNAGDLYLSGKKENKYHNGSIEYFDTTGEIRVDAVNVLLGIRYVF